MDSSRNGTYSLNELILTVDLAGKSGVILSFYHKEFGDEDHGLPGSFVGSRNGDGVAISADGNTWYKVKGLVTGGGISSGWKKFTVNLDAFAAAARISYNSNFKIKFQQYDNDAIPSDGFALDDIQISISGQTADADRDGLPDDWERRYFGNLNKAAGGDADGDGLTNLAEYQLGTSPAHADTDGDRMPDGWEVQYALNPLDPADAAIDADGDGKTNLEEYLAGTNPRTASAVFPFSENFEGGRLAGWWTARSTGAGRIAVTSANSPYAGNYHLTMDSSVNGSYSLNELILTIDLAGKSGVMLTFYHKDMGDEDHFLPAAFLNSANGEGVAISADGVAWYTVQGLTSVDGVSGAWKKYEIDLDAAAADAGISYTALFKIKFQQYDNDAIPTGGFAFDNIVVGSQATPPGPGSDNNLLAQERELLTLINQQRAQNGLAPLRTSDALCRAARGHSNDMAQNNFFSHTGSDGSSPWDRIADAGYHLRTGGENVGAGYPTAADMVNGWMNSAGHRANILGNFCDVGVGYAYSATSAYRHYWTLDLGCQ
jgi:uncharacterized protein YkwD